MTSLLKACVFFILGGIHISRCQMRGEGVDEMTINDHEGEGFQKDHEVRWSEFSCFSLENGCMNSPFE